MSSLNDNRVETLHLEYEMAVNLYMHEDSLNWEKLNHFLYISAGLLAIIGFIYEQTDSMSYDINWLMVVICGMGLLTALSFYIALSSGVQYLQIRKEAVIRIEKILHETAGGDFVVGVADLNEQDNMTFTNGERIKDKHISKSPTTLMLKGLPLLFAVMWLFFAIVIVLN